jgi:osmotically-inducible protein OsmY
MGKIMRSDPDIKRDVENELRWSPALDATDIAVAVKNGTVELAGFVKLYSDKYEAEYVVKRVAGVAGLANDIEVRLADYDQRPDPDIARDAVSAIEYNGLTNIQPTVRDGRVTLDGTVEWFFQKERAAEAVRFLKGVKSVTNLIQLKPRVAPADVKRKIEQALERSARIVAGQITVEVAGGIVTLRGSVRSWAERDEAEDAAWAAPGVTQVNDQIMIGS